MRDRLKYTPESLTSILRVCKQPIAMEVCDEFTNLQKICRYCDKNVKELEKIQYRGGNEQYIAEFAYRIKSFLKNKNFYKEEEEVLDFAAFEENLRKISFYLILNTDSGCQKDLTEDENVCHCVKMMPQLSKCLLVHTIWDLALDDFFYEMLAYSPPWFMSRFLAEAVESLRHYRPFETMERVEGILQAILTNVGFLDNRDMSEAEKKSTVFELLNYVEGLIRALAPPVEVEEWSEMKRAKYLGIGVDHLLRLSVGCLKLLITRSSIEIPRKFEMYFLLKDRLVEGKRDAYTAPVEEGLNQMLLLLLNALEAKIVEVSALMFIEWYEVEVDDPLGVDDAYTLQDSVSSQAFELDQMNRVHQIIAHEVFSKLENFKRERKATAAVARELNMGDLIDKLTKKEIAVAHRKEFLREFLDRGLIYDNEECLNTLEGVSDLLGLDEVKLVYEKANQEMVDEELRPKIAEILKTAFKSLSETEIIDLIGFLLENFDEEMSSIEFGVEFEPLIYVQKFKVDEFLLKLVENPKLFLKMLPDIVQNTQKFTREAHRLAIENFIAVLVRLQPVWPKIKDTFQETLNALFASPVAPSFDGVAYLVAKFFASPLADRMVLVKSFLFKNLSEKTSTRVIHALLSIERLVESDQLKDYLAPLLVSIAVIVDEARSSMREFKENAQLLLESGIRVLEKVMKAFLPHASPVDRKFVATQVGKKLKMTTRFYFQKLHLSVEESPKRFDAFVFPEGTAGLSKPEVTAMLCEHLSQCSAKEMLWLAENPELKELFPDAMLIVILSFRPEEMKFVFEFCFKNFSIIFKTLVAEERLVEANLELFRKILNILEKSPREFREVAIYSILPHIKQLVEGILKADPSKNEALSEGLKELNLPEEEKALIFQSIQIK